MKVWTCTTFEGRWPVGTSAVVAAPTKERAAEILNENLKVIRLKPTVRPEEMIEFPTGKEKVTILNDGEY